MTSFEARPSVRSVLAEARSLAGLDPASPSAARQAAEMQAVARREEAATTNAGSGGGGEGNDFFAPVSVAIDRTGGHAAMREDILLPLDVSDEAASRLASKLCQETGMAPDSAEAIKEQVLEHLAPFREEEVEDGGGHSPPSTSGRGVAVPRPRPSSSSSSPRVVDIALVAHCDGVRVQDRILWDLSDPAPLTAAWAAETAKDLGLSAKGCKALREELEAAVAQAKRVRAEAEAGEHRGERTIEDGDGDKA